MVHDKGKLEPYSVLEKGKKVSFGSDTPLHTSLALFLITSPFSFNLFLKIHFVPMTFLSFGRKSSTVESCSILA